MRSHLAECFANQEMEVFPIKATKRMKKLIKKEVIVYICPVCKQIDNDNSEIMVACDSCDNWFHDICIPLKPSSDTKEWFCLNCPQPA